MKHTLKLPALLLLLTILFVMCAVTGRCALKGEIDRSVIKSLDLNNYMGRWYEVARFDHSFERGMSNVTAEYTLQPDGTVRVVNRGVRNGKQQEAIGKAKTTAEAGRLRSLCSSIRITTSWRWEIMASGHLSGAVHQNICGFCHASPR